MSFPAVIRLTDEDILKQTSDQRNPLGTQGVTRDGRKFRYARNGATALTLGHLVQSPGIGSAYVQTTGLTADNYFASAPTTNSSAVKLRFLSTKTMMGSTVDYFKDGFIWIRTGTGAGQMLRILSHGAATSTALAGKTVNLAWDSRLSVAPVTTTAVRVGVLLNKYARVIPYVAAAYTAQAGIPVGVAPRAITANYYFWVQTGGLALVKRLGTVTRGRMVKAATSTATVSGAIAAWVPTTTAAAVYNGMAYPVGVVVIAGSTVNSAHALINLTIE